MTDDIVTRLRNYRRLEFFPPICSEAADEIERLRAERDEARRQLLQHLHPDIKKAIDAARQCDCSKGESCP
jgi:hypothetical protein